jgi:hypothetical protein
MFEHSFAECDCLDAHFAFFLAERLKFATYDEKCLSENKIFCLIK